MVASRRPRSFSSVDQLDVDGDTRKVLPYPGNSPSQIPLWREHIRAALDDAKVLVGIDLADVAQDTLATKYSSSPTKTISFVALFMIQ